MMSLSFQSPKCLSKSVIYVRCGSYLSHVFFIVTQVIGNFRTIRVFGTVSREREREV